MTSLQIEMSITAIVSFILILIFLKRSSLSVKNSLAWLLLPLICLIIAIFPEPLSNFSSWLGFETPSNFFFLIFIGVLFAICFFLTISISKQQKIITKLVQEVSILKNKDSNGKRK
ncbi:DUF2304 domain-containing protein [Candidatus Saccharibacteria bacterium]|nr:DUF2304 domain-containing protein [Candidatus Saccharibacteria bacterium]